MDSCAGGFRLLLHDPSICDSDSVPFEKLHKDLEFLFQERSALRRRGIRHFQLNDLWLKTQFHGSNLGLAGHRQLEEQTLSVVVSRAVTRRLEDSNEPMRAHG